MAKRRYNLDPGKLRAYGIDPRKVQSPRQIDALREQELRRVLAAVAASPRKRRKRIVRNWTKPPLRGDIGDRLDY